MLLIVTEFNIQFWLDLSDSLVIIQTVSWSAGLVPFTGVKPSGTPIDDKILAVDKSIETGNLSALKGMVSADMLPELTERFEKVMSLRNFDVNNVEAGMEYIEAYVQFFKFAEGEELGYEAGDGIK